MIDRLIETQALILAMRAVLPLTASFTPEVAAALGREVVAARGSWRVVGVDYAGDEGGIMCRMIPGDDDAASAVFASLTQLRFMARSPLAREIAVYQKRRTKKLRKLNVSSVQIANVP